MHFDVVLCVMLTDFVHSHTLQSGVMQVDIVFSNAILTDFACSKRSSVRSSGN